MKSFALYNMKGGVGKSTTAVNLSYLAAAAGQRTLLWDLDPQAASSFAFRVRPHVAGFGKKCLKSGEALGAAIKETDYSNLDLLPADFAYRKLDRLLGHFDKPERVVADLLDTLGRDYDVVFLDCPAGFSLLTEGVLAAVDAVLLPTIPTVLSLRMVARVIKWADRSGSRSVLAAFFNMVDRRKSLHRRACEWSKVHPELFLAGQIAYASVVEQMAVRRMPLPVFAARDSATSAFAEIWAQLQSRLPPAGERTPRQQDSGARMLQAIESLIARLESVDGQEPDASRPALAVKISDPRSARRGGDVEGLDSPGLASAPDARSAPEEGSLGEDPYLVHSFDTERRDLERCGRVLELRERKGSLLVVVARSGSDEEVGQAGREQVEIDSSWALKILSGVMSPLEALSRRLGQPGPCLVEDVRVIVGGRRLQRVDSRVARHSVAEGRERPHDHTAASSSTIRHADRVVPFSHPRRRDVRPSLGEERLAPVPARLATQSLPSS